MDEPVTDPEDREQQAALSHLMLYHLSAPMAEGCRLRGVLPASGAVRIAVQAGEGEDSRSFLYEIPNDTVAPAHVPGMLRAVLAGPQYYSSGDVSEVMGMTLVRLHPEELDPVPETGEGLALTVLRALSDPGDVEHPFLIGFLLRGGTLRLYVQRPDGPGIVGADIRLTEATTALIASLPALVGEEQHWRRAPDDPHCDLLVDLTGW